MNLMRLHSGQNASLYGESNEVYIEAVLANKGVCRGSDMSDGRRQFPHICVWCTGPLAYSL
jgi:hypothetical protein